MGQKVIDALQSAFPGIEVQLDEIPGERISGMVIWAGFAALDQVDRQNRIRAALKKELGAEVTQVGVLLTYTRDEINAMRAA